MRDRWWDAAERRMEIDSFVLDGECDGWGTGQHHFVQSVLEGAKIFWWQRSSLAKALQKRASKHKWLNEDIHGKVLPECHQTKL